MYSLSYSMYSLPHLLPLRVRTFVACCLLFSGIFSSGCAQFGGAEHPPANTEFCATSGWIENGRYQGVICFAPVDPITEGARSDSYVLQPGPIRFVLPVESTP